MVRFIEGTTSPTRSKRAHLLSVLFPLLAVACRTTPPVSSVETASMRSDDDPVIAHEPGPTWGALQPGPQSVGYRVHALSDESRMYRSNTEVESYARPVVVGIWYPAVAETGEAMVVGDYFRVPPDVVTQTLARRIDDYLLGVVYEEVLGVPQELATSRERERITGVLETKALAQSGARPARSGGPFLLAHPGLGGAFGDGFVLFEYLASHGWVVVAVLAQQATGQRINVGWDAPTSVRDLDLVHERIGDLLGESPSAYGVAGHSYGAQMALVYSTLPDRVQAVVSLDSTMENGGDAAPWWKNGEDAEWLDRPAAVEVPALIVASKGSSRAYFEEMAGPRTLLTVPDLQHNDYEGLGGVLRSLVGPCPEESECTVRHQRYLELVRIVGSFLGQAIPTQSLLGGDAEREQELGFVRVHADVAVGQPPEREPVRALPALDIPADCRVDATCDAVGLLVDEAEELAALGRGEEALLEVDAKLLDKPDQWRLLELRGRLLARIGRAEDASRAFTAAGDILDGVDDPPVWVRSLADLMRSRSARARSLASDAVLD